MRVAITGATGLIGTALSQRLRALGHETTPVSRSPRGAGTIVWDPMSAQLDPGALRRHDAVVNLAGQNIGLGGRWRQSSQKVSFRDSRVVSTEVIARAMASLDRDDAPRTLVSITGTHYYGDRGDEVLTESSPPGDEGFLAEVCHAWEAATAPADAAGIRVVNLRAGAVQAPQGGSLQVLLVLYRLGLGGRVGSGQQFWSWISIEDMVGIIVHALEADHLAGPVNATAPGPVRQMEYARTLAKVLRRPAIVPAPRFGPRLVLGDMVDELLFYSQRAVPERATASGYDFRHPDLEQALRALLGRTAGGRSRR